MNETYIYKAIGAVIGGAILVMAKPIYDIISKQSKVIFANTKFKSERKIQILIDEMRARMDVDRVTIFMYSNGEDTLNGFPFLYGNMIFEASPYVKSLKAEMIKFPTSWFSSILFPLIDAKVTYCRWNDDGKCYLSNGETLTDINAAMIMKGYNIDCSVMFKFTHNIGDGILSISHSQPINIEGDDLGYLIAKVHQVWYHLKLKR